MTNLKYKQTWQLRREILDAVGVATKEVNNRFENGSDRGIRKDNLIVVASKLQPPGISINYANARLTDIYKFLGQWMDVEHSGNAGRDWTMNRDLLKAIHEAVHNNE